MTKEKKIDKRKKHAETRELVYSSVDRVTRWNFCQQIAKFILNSSIETEELQNAVSSLEQDRLQIIFNVSK